MATYANQKTIKINRTTPEKGKGQFLQIYSQNLSEASRLLTAVGFKLYLYLASNQNNYEKDYSPRDFANVYGVSYESARKAPKNLIDNGYLIPNDNKLEFFETPQQVEIPIEEKFEIPEEEKRWMPTKNGGRAPITYDELYNGLKDKKSETTIQNIWNKLEVIYDV